MRRPGRDVAPAWGWRGYGAGRVAHVDRAAEYQATTVQAAGLYPFSAGSGAPTVGIPIGRHLLWGETVCLDPMEWLTAGLTVNPGVFVLGQPGVGKSTMAKRLSRGLAAMGVRIAVLGDTKPDYTPLVESLGGQVIRVGRGLDRINPLDAGPLGDAARRLGGAEGERLRVEMRGRRLSSLLALLTLVRRTAPIAPGEEVILGAAIDLLGERLPAGHDPTVPDVLQVIRDGPDQLHAAAETDAVDGYRNETRALRQTLGLLLKGPLAGVFDGPTTRPIDLDAPAVSVDLSALAAAGDTLVAAAMLATWSYGYASVDGRAALAEAGLAPRRRTFVILDELWRALRGAPGLVEHADALTRLNRARGMGHMMLSHSLADLDALPTEEDRSKARGFIDRCAVTILGGLPPRELAAVDELVPLSGPERELVGSWSSSGSWEPTAQHPGRGRYLIKTGGRTGIPVVMELIDDEHELYDTDAAMRLTSPGPPRRASTTPPQETGFRT
ncbi:hypothetical protein [Nitriliruptor alkaliphilus]|uniref:hypothetical protein n=1 Tax=Nitriliruptor alkaliphilus TaxID=427918 RepID=UPI000ADBEC31|nr:hypothetical protein [Nitriliruptor alkaliphilus]